MSKMSGTLILVSAPSGCGKDTVLKEVFKKDKELRFSISYTSRPERDPADREKYNLVSEQEFLKMLENNEFLEYNKYGKNYYGTRKKPVDDWLSEGKNVILEIDVNGAKNVKKVCPKAVSIFIMPPSMAELERRLRNRGTESDEDVKKRLEIAAEEITHAKNYDYICINNELSECVEDILTVIKAQSFTKNTMKDFIEEVEKDAESFNR